MTTKAFRSVLLAALGFGLISGCLSSEGKVAPTDVSSSTTSPPGTRPAVPAAAEPVAETPPRVAEPSGPTEPAAAEPAPDESAPAGQPGGHDFAPQAALLYRMASCGGDAAVAPRFAKIVARHCKHMLKQIARYKKKWARPAGEFIAALRPDNLPGTVVYPFGGGDLVSALVVFPDAAEITTVSLEAAGDPRTIDNLSRSQLRDDLKIIGQKYQRLLLAAHSTTKSLQIASHSRLSGTVVFALAALAVHDFEPVALRYFRIEKDGSLHYLDESELDAAEAAARARRKAGKRYKTRQVWREQHAGFANMELRYRRRGNEDDRIRVYRHIVANLDDPHLDEDDRVLEHLARKGKVAVVTKAASYLLWLDEFSKIRQYLLDHTAWMISDSSGIPPNFAEPAGFAQITYGEFTGPYFYRDPKRITKQMSTLWEKNPKRKLPFRFGYPDAAGKNHMLIMQPKE